MPLIEAQNQQRKSLSNCRYAALNKFTLDPEWLPLTFALTREQKGREAPLLRVGVERGVMFH